MSSFLVEVIFAFLSVFPGIVVVSKLFKWKVTDAQSVILGILFWDFLFASISIVVGCTSSFLNYFFYVFTGASAVISVWWLVKTLARKRDLKSFRFALSVPELPLVSLIVVLLVFVALVMAFHPMFVENDAIWSYIPYAKGLVATGGFHNNVLVASDVDMTKMPLMQIYYAWGLSVFGKESFRLIPFTLIILAVFVIYKISQELFPKEKEISLMAPAVFLTLPVMLVTVSLYAFYVDLPLMAFTAASVFCAVMAIRYDEAKWYLFAGLSVALAILSKEDFIAFIISLCIISLQFSKKYRLLSLSVAASAFYFFIIRSSIVLSPSNSLFMVSVVFKQVPVVILLILLASIMFYVSNSNRSLNRDSLTKVFYFLIPSSVVLFFVLRNWLLFGTPTWLAGYITNTMGLTGQPSLFQFLRFDLLFDTTGLGNIYLILVILGFAYIVKTIVSKKNLAMATLGIWIILLLMNWSFFYNFQFTIAEIRRLLYVAPFVSIIAAIGFSFLYNHLSKRNTEKNFTFFFAWLFCFLVLICTSIFQLAFVRLAGTYLSYIVFPMSGGLSPLPMSEDLFTLPTFLVSLLIPLIIVLLVYLGNKTGFFSKLSKPYKLSVFSRRRKISARALSSVALIAIILVSLVPLNVLQMIANANDSHWDSGEYAKKALVPSWWDFMPEIIDYYNSSLPDNYATVSYGLETTAIAYFLDRSVVNIDQGVYGYSFLKSNNTEELLGSLYASNIRYFLIPNENAASYPQYMAVSSRLLLFRLISDRDYFFLLKDFPCYSLYKLVLPSDKRR
jgi:hypothetical protein